MLQQGFPNNLRDDVVKVTGLLPQKTYHNVAIDETQQTVEYLQGGQVIKFPYRNYYMDISDHYIDTLSVKQKMILHCIYTRNCDGYVRQKHLKSLLLMNYEDWAIPYIVKICDEYVVEIIEMTYDILKQQDTELIRKFCIENREAFC